MTPPLRSGKKQGPLPDRNVRLQLSAGRPALEQQISSSTIPRDGASPLCPLFAPQRYISFPVLSAASQRGRQCRTIIRSLHTTPPHCNSANAHSTSASWRHCNLQAIARAPEPVTQMPELPHHVPHASRFVRSCMPGVRAEDNFRVLAKVLAAVLVRSEFHIGKKPLFLCYNPVLRRLLEESHSLVGKIRT